MSRILLKKEAPGGCQVNHITSGKPCYMLYDTSGFKAYSFYGAYADESSARDAAAGLEDAYAEQLGDEWGVWSFDKELTEHDRPFLQYGDLAGVFDTREEAEMEARQYEYYVICEEDPGECYVVADISRHKKVFDTAFPSRLEALACLYHYTEPAAWMRFMELSGKGGRDE